MPNPSANNGSPVKAHSKIPKIAIPTQILFLKSHLLSPNLIERMEIISCEMPSHAGRRRTSHGAPPTHELITIMNVNTVHVHQDAEDGFVLPFSIDPKYGKNAIKETIGAAIPKIS